MEGIDPLHQYVVLGDDVVIANEKIAIRYKEILTSLNIPLSEQKSMVSKDTYEFAKRWFFNDAEVSPFPIGGVLETWKKYYLLQNTLETAERKGYSFPTSDARREYVQKLLTLFGKGQQSARIIKKFELFHGMMIDNKTGKGNVASHEALVTYYPDPVRSREDESLTLIIHLSKSLLAWKDLLTVQEFYSVERDLLKRGFPIGKESKSTEKNLESPLMAHANL